MSSFNKKLKHVDIEITRQCNLLCVHCSAQSKIRGRELSFLETKRILDEASLLGLENVGFTGGEPLMRTDKLMRLLKYTKCVLNMKTHLHTNGTLLKEKHASAISELADEVSITLLGALPKTHDGVTSAKGSLKATRMGLNHLLTKHANLRIYLVPMKSNYKETPKVIENSYQIGCSKFRLLSVSPTGRARESFEAISLNFRERKWLLNELSTIKKELAIDIDAGFCTRQDYPQLSELHGHQSCLAAEDRMHIDAFGEAFPCTASSGLRTFSGGNVTLNNCSVADVWRYAPMFQFFRFFHVNPPAKCRRCTSYERCMGGCRVMMFHKYGDFTVAKPCCKPLKSSS